MDSDKPAIHRPTTDELRAAAGKLLPDLLRPGLDVVFCGINPSLYSAAVGHHFARPGNRFWPALHRAGFTGRLLSAFEDASLLDRGYGLTNIAPRATAAADELTAEELRRGLARLERKVRRLRPRAIAFLGGSAFGLATGRKKVVVGDQEVEFGGALCWVLPNPSGRNAHYQLDDLARVFESLRRALAAGR